ncbi:hypothetical protein FC093_03850 [Ilyomonas limi]|uniref:Outer membrane protein beta-barrel domain-containing protein n=1 Tax=Ilyomonas limi TaxID=2575867 RepID=A0A4U3L718_9BACT|nr:hypothetical protein [Ilyomonas limi]TKK70840.1 hypothetical protein FC093_03850 [Ilyomonas limi]
MTRKTITILLTLLACITIVKGQITNNSVLLGGQISYQNSNYDYAGTQATQKYKAGVFNVSIGKAVKDNSVFGFNVSYAPSTSENTYNGSSFFDVDTKQYSVGIFNRQYKKLAKDFYFFAESGVAYNNTKQVYDDTNNVNIGTVKQWGGQLNLAPGISYRILNKLHIEITIPNIVLIQYLKTSDRPAFVPVTDKSFTFSTSLNSSALSSLGVGFHFIL